MIFRRIAWMGPLLMALLLLNGSCAKEVPDRDIDQEIQELMTIHGLPSVVAAIVKGEEVVWQRAYGYADRQNQLPASQESIYHIASISKLFIATAIMQLEEKGLVDLDADINLYLPVSIRNIHFPETPITLRMLMNHSAGIAWPQHYIEAKGIWEHFPPDEAPPPSEWIPQFLVPDGEYYNPRIWKDTEPGTFELYSNIGSCVIAYVVEQVSGKNFRSYCKIQIFEPLGMHATSYNLVDLDSAKMAVLYFDDNSPLPFFDDRLAASGGLKTSAEDLCRFMMAWLGNGSLGDTKILEPETVSRMMQVSNPVSGICLLWRAGLGDWYGHRGGMDGAATSLDLQPHDGVGFIIFTNKHEGVVYPGKEIYGLVRQQANTYR